MDEGRRRFLRAAVGGVGLAGLSVAGYRATNQFDSPLSQRRPQADIYVAPNGSTTNDGTKGSPFARIESALEASTPGDVVLVRDGTYKRRGFVEIQNVSGTPDNPIRIRGEAKKVRPTITWRKNAYGGGIVIENSEHLRFESLEIARSPNRGIRITGSSSNITLRDLDVHQNGHAGITITNSESNRLVGVVSHDNYDEESFGNNADGVQVTGEGSADNLLRQVRTYRNSDDGVDLYQSTGTTIEDSISWNNGVGPDGNRRGDGNGFKLGGGTLSGGNTVIRCLAYSNEHRGFDYNASKIPNVVVNNTAWNNPVNYRFEMGSHVLINNLSVSGSRLFNGPVVETANSWNLGIQNPQFRTTDPSKQSFLHLRSGSPAIDAGVETNLVSYRGEAPDLGAIEFSPS